MMKLHSLGTAANCGQCGQPSKALYAETTHAAIHLGQGLCPTCHKAQAVPLQVEHTERAWRRRPGRSLVGMVEDERELMRGKLTGAVTEASAEVRAEIVEMAPVIEATEEVGEEKDEGDGDEGGSL